MAIAGRINHQGAGLGRSLLQDVILRCVEAAEAMSGSVSAAVPNKPFKAIDMFIICFLCC